MNAAAVSANPSASLQTLLQDRYHDFNNLQSALQNGNISNAQQAFAAFQQDAQKTAQLSGANSLFGAGTQASKDLQALGGALKSADLSGAQKAFATLTRDITSASQSAQVIDNVSLHHPNLAKSVSNGARAFGSNPAMNGTAKAAGTVLNQQA
jgi:hypothetical protein